MRYPKEVVLKNGEEAIIRPLETGDRTRLCRFYSDIPEKDRWYMCYDPLAEEAVDALFAGMDSGDIYSVVALHGEEIVAHASLYLSGHGCTRHVGRLRIMVGEDFRQKRLGTWMLLDLIRLAMDKGLSDIRSDFVVGKEDGAIEAAVKLDFFKKALLEEYVQDPDGNRHDLMIMVKRLHRGFSDF